MLKFFLCLFILIVTFGCKTTHTEIADNYTGASSYVLRNQIVGLSPLKFQKKQGFRYQVPEDMQESPDYADMMRYDNLLLDKGAAYNESSVVIAIRHYDLNNGLVLDDFVKRDQLFMKQSVKPAYKKGWKPRGLDEKSIEYKSFEFSYKVKKSNIYQRSVYLRCENTIHIISQSSFYKELLTEDKSEEFWNSIRID